MRQPATKPLPAAFGLTMAMLAVATLAKSTIPIFPEASALAVGCWVNRERRWVEKPWQIVVLVTVSSVVGVGLNHLATGLTVREILALTVVVSLLLVTGSPLSPSISAALLPVLLNIRSWFFVLAVFGLTLTVAIGAGKKSEATGRGNKFIKADVIYLLTGLAWIGISGLSHFSLLVIPPMMVVLYEWLTKPQPSTGLKLGIRQLGLLFSSALAGSIAARLLPRLPAASGGVAVIVTIGLMYLFNTRFPPAMAISLLPLLLGDLPVWEFPLYVLIDGAVFLFIGFCAARLGLMRPPDNRAGG